MLIRIRFSFNGYATGDYTGMAVVAQPYRAMRTAAPQIVFQRTFQFPTDDPATRRSPGRFCPEGSNWFFRSVFEQFP